MTGAAYGFTKFVKAGNEGTLSDKDVEKKYMPVVFDNNDRVMGYGSKFLRSNTSISVRGNSSILLHLPTLIDCSVDEQPKLIHFLSFN